jgi:hypothetical protein
MRPLITILYEDQLNDANPKQYGPHKLLLACVAEHLSKDHWYLDKQIVALPKKGNGSLKKTLESKVLQRLVNCEPVIAVFDDDEVRPLYGLSASACKSEVLGRINPIELVEIILLEQNIEYLIRICCEIVNKPIPYDKPTPSQRDKILNSIANNPSVQLQIIQDRMSSFGRLVQKTICFYRKFLERQDFSM